MPEPTENQQPNLIFYEVLTGEFDAGLQVLVQIFRKPDGTIWWIAESESKAWIAFFSYPTPMPSRPPMAEAIQAYQAIGYRCVRVRIEELPDRH